MNFINMILNNLEIVIAFVLLIVVGVIIYSLYFLHKNKSETTKEASDIPLPLMKSAEKRGGVKNKKVVIKKSEEVVANDSVSVNVNKTIQNKPIKRKTILVVDDSKLILKSINEFLLKNNYNVLLANNGFEALNTLETKRPDLILSDIEMPPNSEGVPCDGFDLLNAINTSVKYSTIPVILMTANLEIAAEKGFNLGAKGFLSKPFNYEYMLDQIEYCLDEASI